MAGEWRSQLTSQVCCQVTVRYTRWPWRPRWSREPNAHPRTCKIKQIHIIRAGCYSVSRQGLFTGNAWEVPAEWSVSISRLCWEPELKTCSGLVNLPCQSQVHSQTGRHQASVPGKSSAPHEPVTWCGHPWTCSSAETHRLIHVLLCLCLQLWDNTLHFLICFNEMSLLTKCSCPAWAIGVLLLNCSFLLDIPSILGAVHWWDPGSKSSSEKLSMDQAVFLSRELQLPGLGILALLQGMLKESSLSNSSYMPHHPFTDGKMRQRHGNCFNELKTSKSLLPELPWQKVVTDELFHREIYPDHRDKG